MKQRIYKNTLRLLSIVLLMTLLASSGSIAETKPLKLSKEDAKALVINYSPIIKGLEKSRNDLVRSFSSLNKNLSGLQTLYDYLPQYKQLYNLYQQMVLIPDYVGYLQIAILGNVVNTTAYVTAHPALAAPIADPNNMTVIQYGTFVSLQPQFALIGITDPNLSSAQEYELFISPLRSSTMSMQTGVMNLGIAVDSTKAALKSGVETLYDSVILLEGYLELQEMSYTMAKSDFETASKKYKSGLISKAALETAENKQRIAVLNRDSMLREVDNLKMRLNLMLGLDVTTVLELTTTNVINPTLGSLDEYISQGLEARNEMQTFKNDHQNVTYQFTLIKGYYSPSSPTYKVAEAEVKDSEYKKLQLEQQITLEINKAYLDAIEKEHEMILKKAVMNDAINQRKDLEKSIKLGFATSSTLNGMDLFVTQATNDYYTASRDYHAAYIALQNASSIGPAYQN